MYKEFYCPIVLPVKLNQLFGENRACVDSKGKVITCDGNNPPVGFKSVYGPNGHLGVDLSTYRGQEVFCAHNGFVDQIDTNPRTGLDVRIISYIGERRIRHIYEHLLGHQHEVGDIVKTGELIGWADNTGYSSADHLHYQTEEFIDGKWVPIDPLSITDMTICAKDILYINNKLVWAKEQLAIIAERIAERLRKKVVNQ